MNGPVRCLDRPGRFPIGALTHLVTALEASRWLDRCLPFRRVASVAANGNREEHDDGDTGNIGDY
jgi:hypothetical protein